MNDDSQIAIYTTPNGDAQIDVTMREDTIWMTQDAMARLFQTTTPNINMHIRNVLKDGELDRVATIKDFLTVRTEGRRRVSRNITHYNLDMILSVGYRVKSKTATQPHRKRHHQASNHQRIEQKPTRPRRIVIISRRAL